MEQLGAQFNVSTARSLSEVMHPHTAWRVMGGLMALRFDHAILRSEYNLQDHDFPQERIQMKLLWGWSYDV